MRLIVEREREIIAFNSTPFYRIQGVFHPQTSKKSVKVKAFLEEKFSTREQAYSFLENCKESSFAIEEIETKDLVRTPAPPFTTSALQQEAARKLGLSVTQTMRIAQKLYESGLITYMRTDSTNLSQLAINSAKQTICTKFGEEYSKVRAYKTKSKGAQEAHEAIRPTYLANDTIEGTPQEKKLYNLIWKRTIASQMADAKLEKTTIELPVQIQGKVRGTVSVDKDMSQEQIVQIALENPEINKYVTNGIKKVIYVAGRILNIIV